MLKNTLFNLTIILSLQCTFAVAAEKTQTQIPSATDAVTQATLEPQRSEAIMALAKAGYQLIFFTSSRCLYCHQFAPIVKSMVDQYGFGISVISFDGKPTPPFTEATLITKDVYKIFYKDTTPFAPMLFLHHPTAQKFVPLAEGFTDSATVQKVLLHYAEQKGLLL